MDVCSNGMFQYRNTAFRVHSSYNSTESEIKSQSLSNSPHLKSETSSSIRTESDTCRTIVSMLIHQRKTNRGLEQQLKHLQSTNKASTSQSPIESNSINNDRSNSNQSLTIKQRFSLDEHQQRNFIFHNSQHHSLGKTLLFSN